MATFRLFGLGHTLLIAALCCADPMLHFDVPWKHTTLFGTTMATLSLHLDGPTARAQRTFQEATLDAVCVLLFTDLCRQLLTL